jgi:hypothetical protein
MDEVRGSIPLGSTDDKASTMKVTVFLAACLSLLACNSDGARGPAKDASLAAPGAPDAATSAPAPSSGGAPAACTTDGDCRTWSSYCAEAPCVCRAVAKSEGEPHCASPTPVSCFVDPCMKRAAACQGGRCELVMGASP